MAAAIFLLVIGILHFAHGLVEYVVYPADRKDVSACSQINTALVRLLGESKVRVYWSQTRLTTEFWFIQAIESQKGAVLRIPGVDAVIENRIIAKNTEEVSANASAFTTAGGMRSSKANPPLNFPDRSQRDAPQDLDIVSWPARKRIPGFGKMPAYVYDIARGVDTYIYIIDNGINQDNAEFKSMPWPPDPSEWHYAYGVSRSTTDDNLAGHGSCVASKAAGWKTGVSKNSRLVVMKSLPTVADVNFAFAAALDDIIEKKRQGRAVVLYPATSIKTYPRYGLPKNWWSVKEIIKELFAQDVVVVTGAGNDAARTLLLDTVPAMWGLDEDFPLIVAGAVKIDGTITLFSQGAADSARILWAPGESVVCANGPSSPGLTYRSGTSLAAAMVAGLAAYQMTGPTALPPGPVPKIVRSLLFETGRPIYPWLEPIVIWNRMPGRSDALLENSTSQPMLQLVPNATSVFEITNVTEGRAAVA